MEVKNADELFKEFRENSIAEFFKKNRQMLGYSGMVRSLVTVVHEYVSNGIDACEEANIKPSIEVAVSQIADNKYRVKVKDNGPGIPKKFIGKALASVLSGTKFHRYIQQRGQQGIGASGCTLFSQVTTGKPIHVTSRTHSGAYSCDISIDIGKNAPVVANYADLDPDGTTGLMVEGDFAEVKYENSDHGVYEYLKRTALSNPHVSIRFTDPSGAENTFMSALDELPKRPVEVQPHPLGLSINDLLDFSRVSESKKVSSFLSETFARVSSNKVAELRELAKAVDFEKGPKELTWADAEEIIAAIKQVKWIAPEASGIVPIGERQIGLALKNILNPQFMNVVERKPRVFRGGIPFVVEAAVAYGGRAGAMREEGSAGVVLRFANRVPLLFDTGNCAITEAVKQIQWKRYNIDLENQPVSIFVNLSSVYVPYSGVSKEAISKEDELVEEIKLALMDAARGVQQYIRRNESIAQDRSRYRTTMRYVKELSTDLADITGEKQEKIEQSLESLVASHYPSLKKDSEAAEEADAGQDAAGAESAGEEKAAEEAKKEDGAEGEE